VAFATITATAIYFGAWFRKGALVN
jgi:hypothetical protein